MPKLLVIEATIVNYGDDKGGQHQDVGDFIEPNKDTATALVRAGRCLFVAKADDWDKNGLNTASKDMLDAAKAMAKGKPRAAEPAAEPTA